MKERGGWLALIIAPIFLVVGLHWGIRLPDIDHDMSFLKHRSIVTHGPLIPVILFGVALRLRFPPARLFAMGGCLAFAVHHAFDLFPVGWGGGALIQVPFYGSTSATFSWLWIAFSILAGTYLAAQLARGVVDVGLYALGVGYMFISTVPKEHTWLGPAIALIIAAVVSGIFALPSKVKQRELRHNPI